MSVKLLSVKDLACGVMDDSATQIKGITEREGKVKVVALLVGDSPATTRFVAEKGAACQQAEIDFLARTFPNDASPSIIDERLSDLARDRSVKGVMVSVSYGVDVTVARAKKRLPAAKDILIEHPDNLSNVLIDPEESACPPLCAAVSATFITHEIDLYAKSVLIIGEKDLFGLPMAAILLRRNASVMICPTFDDVNHDFLVNCDIIICNGVPAGAIGRDDIKNGAILLDVGAPGPGSLTQDDLTGGGAFREDIEEKAGAILPAGAIRCLEKAFFVHNIVHFARLSEGESGIGHNQGTQKNSVDNGTNHRK